MSHLYDTGTLEIIPALDPEEYDVKDYTYDSYVSRVLKEDQIEVTTSTGAKYTFTYISKVGWYGDYSSLGKYEGALWKRDGLKVDPNNLPY